MPLGQQVIDGEEAGLEVQRVEDGLGQQHIGPAVEQGLGLFIVGGGQHVEVDGPITGVVDVRRERGGAIGGADGTGDEGPRRRRRAGRRVRLGRPCGPEVVAGLARAGYSREVDGPDLARQVVVGHRHAVGVEGIGGDDVRPGLQIAAVDARDGLGLGDRQQVVAALEVAVKGGKLFAAVVGLAEPQLLDHGAHRAVQNGDAAGKEVAKPGKKRT